MEKVNKGAFKSPALFGEHPFGKSDRKRLLNYSLVYALPHPPGSTSGSRIPSFLRTFRGTSAHACCSTSQDFSDFLLNYPKKGGKSALECRAPLERVPQVFSTRGHQPRFRARTSSYESRNACVFVRVNELHRVIIIVTGTKEAGSAASKGRRR